MSLLFSTQDEGGGSFTEQLAFKSYHFLSTIVVFKPRFLLRTHAKRFVAAIFPVTTYPETFHNNDFCFCKWLHTKKTLKMNYTWTKSNEKVNNSENMNKL